MRLWSVHSDMAMAGSNFTKKPLVAANNAAGSIDPSLEKNPSDIRNDCNLTKHPG